VQELRPESHVLCATSVGAGGLFFPHAVPRPRGVPVLLELALPGRQRPMTVAGRIAHSGRGPNGMGVGVEFNQPQPQLLVALRKRPG
jgi:hypothetical protein